MRWVRAHTTCFFEAGRLTRRTDYINPIDLCNKLNQVSRGSKPRLRTGPAWAVTLSRAKLTPPLQFVLPEMIAHAFLTLCFLLSGQWLAFLLNAPLVGYNVNK
jgi:hypothetical protein